jgi:hypothetical protein
MSLCHTVVVEKDLDLVSTGKKAKKQSKKTKPMRQKPTNKNVEPPTATLPDRASPPQAEPSARKVSFSLGKGTYETGNDGEYEAIELADNAAPSVSFSPVNNGKNISRTASPPEPTDFGADGAPVGFAYQAESPDEGSLVSAASLLFGYQVIGRDSSGIQIQCEGNTGSSILENMEVVEALKDGSTTPAELAAKTAMGMSGNDSGDAGDAGPRVETWSILAVNKFDSDRKRMSILLRSPPELGSLPILFCKGADVAMIDPEVSVVVRDDMDASLSLVDISEKDTSEKDDSESGATATAQWEVEQFLELEMHLGDFATEGLRTLVLGM